METWVTIYLIVHLCTAIVMLTAFAQLSKKEIKPKWFLYLIVLLCAAPIFLYVLGKSFYLIEKIAYNYED
jgi:Na+/melibiose symporter-like transporter